MKKEFLDLYMILSVLAGVIGIFYLTTPYQDKPDKSLSYYMILSVITGILALIYLQNHH